ncbi:hypothetical protein NESM_000729300 [Novymonas esmeraldas]|uniref:Uncharacterized protein n=1 Tax=Novymonas esmeraldas TaxID=1808958 RepID=A0AAW0EW57_9TRYP
MAKQQKTKNTPAVAAASAVVPNATLFFSVGPASFADAIVVTKVVSVILPQRHLRDRSVLHDSVLKKLLHRPFEPSADDLAQHADDASQLSSTAAMSSSSSASAPPYVIVHLKSAEVHADTARQANPRGDVQVNVMTTLVAARLKHGICAGVAEVSPFAQCMQVRVPTVAVSAAVAAAEDAAEAEATRLVLGAASHESTRGGDASAPSTTTHECRTGVAEDRQLRVTARCLEDEPVVAGHAVLLISEPAAMRCIAIRPPRAAPGPFSLVEAPQPPHAQPSSSTSATPTDAAAAGEGAAAAAVVASSRGRRSRTSRAAAAAAPARRVVEIECALPVKDGCGAAAAVAGGVGARKRQRA